MLPDLILSVLHYGAIIGVAAILGTELAMVRPGMPREWVSTVARIDAFYGALAVLVLATGLGRAIFTAKGWAYYSANALFWASLGTFAVVGLLSVRPTLAYLRWRRTQAGPGFHPSATEIAGIRRYLWLQVALLPVIAMFATAMAHGYGNW